MPRKIKSLSCMCNGISRRGDAPEDDLVPVNPNRPQGGEYPPPIRLPSERASQQGVPERLLRGHRESGYCRPPQCLLSQRALEEEMGTVLWTPPPPPQRGQLTGESGNMHCRATLVMRFRCRRSHPKIRIFKGMCRSKISLHLCVTYTFSGGSCPHRRQYTALTVNRDCRQTHASLVASRGRMSTRWDCNLKNSASR